MWYLPFYKIGLFLSRSFRLWLLVILYWTLLMKKIFHPMFRFLTSVRMPYVMRTPDECFTDIEFNFQPRYFEFNMGAGVLLPRVHYIDEGPQNGQVILCLHGELTWSFLYRKMVAPFIEKGYRVIALDFIGFGKSDKYTSVNTYSHELHMFTLRQFIEQLDLKDIILVSHDWGTLTGLSVVKDCPRLFSHLVIINSTLPGPFLNMTDRFTAKKERTYFNIFMKSLNFLLWRGFVDLLGTSIPIYNVLQVIMRQPRPDWQLMEGYLAPFPSPRYLAGVVAWPLLYPVFYDDAMMPHMTAVRNCLKRWRKPTFIMFSDDQEISEVGEMAFKRMMPSAKYACIENGGHLPQETKSDHLAKVILRFLKTNPQIDNDNVNNID